MWQIRVFTYLIGREITNKDFVKEMACKNKGYFTQIATIADVEENAVVSFGNIMFGPPFYNALYEIDYRLPNVT